MFTLETGLDNSYLPTAQTEHSAGFDVKSRVDITIKQGETSLVPTGVFIDQDFFRDMFEVEDFFRDDAEAIADHRGLFKWRECESFLSSHYIAFHLRSSLGVKGLILANGVGVIDLDYKGEVCGIIHNTKSEPFQIDKGDRIGQLLIMEHKGAFLPDAFRKKSKRAGGFGSTDQEAKV